MEQLLEEELFLVDGGSITTVAGVAGVIVSPGLGGKLTSGAAAVSGIATVVDGWTAK